MDTTIGAQLAALADQLTTGAFSPATAAATLRALAARNPVALPVIDPARDDLAHWRRLPEQNLRNETYADAWNLAAGLHETERRAHDAREALVRDVEQFTRRAVPHDAR